MSSLQFLFRGRPILLNRLVLCGKLNFVFCFVSFKEELTPKQLHAILTAVSLKSHIVEAQVTSAKTCGYS